MADAAFMADDGIDEPDAARPRIQTVDRIDRFMEVLFETGRQRGSQMPASRKTERIDHRGVKPVSGDIVAYHAHRALPILQRHVAAIPPALPWRTAENKYELQ